MVFSQSSEIKLPLSYLQRKKAVIYQAFISSIEMIPLMVFVFVRGIDSNIQHRIFIGAVLSIAVFGWALRKFVKFTPPYFAVNLFFVSMSLILVLPFPGLSNFFLNLAEAGMFFFILAVAFCWHFLKKNGLLEVTELEPTEIIVKRKTFSWVLLCIYSICPFIALHFKGNENLAGALPFILLLIAEKVLNYFQTRQTSRTH